MTTEEKQLLVPREPTVKPDRKERIREFRAKVNAMMRRKMQVWAYQHMSGLQDGDLVAIRERGIEHGNINWGQLIEEYRQTRITDTK